MPPNTEGKKSQPQPSELKTERKKQLRALGHNLKPIVTIASKGLSGSVLGEIERALKDHELIKIKVASEDREQRKTLAADMATQLKAEVIQRIGKIVVLYRPALKPNPKLSNLQRYS